jgi:hypothetical protein
MPCQVQEPVAIEIDRYRDRDLNIIIILAIYVRIRTRTRADIDHDHESACMHMLVHSACIQYAHMHAAPAACMRTASAVRALQLSTSVHVN